MKVTLMVGYPKGHKDYNSSLFGGVHDLNEHEVIALGIGHTLQLECYYDKYGFSEAIIDQINHAIFDTKNTGIFVHAIIRLPKGDNHG